MSTDPVELTLTILYSSDEYMVKKETVEAYRDALKDPNFLAKIKTRNPDVTAVEFDSSKSTDTTWFFNISFSMLAAPLDIPGKIRESEKLYEPDTEEVRAVLVVLDRIFWIPPESPPRIIGYYEILRGTVTYGGQEYTWGPPTGSGGRGGGK